RARAWSEPRRTRSSTGSSLRVPRPICTADSAPDLEPHDRARHGGLALDPRPRPWHRLLPDESHITAEGRSGRAVRDRDGKREPEDVARDLRVHDVETSGRPRHTEEEEHRAEGSARCSTGRRDVPPLPQRYALRVRAIESIQRSLASVDVEGEPART